jgi:hydroxymethylpyrimidine/phosphomethylpyrimidine kinase
MIPNVLSIAGTDPSGGAGIQADLKSFAANSAYGMAVITAVVSQTTTGVAGVLQMPADVVALQLDTLLADVRIDAVKIGMLGSAEVIATVAAAIDRWDLHDVVLDPVMVAKSGDSLLDPDAVAALRDLLLPRVDLVTPNLPEAARLLGVAPARDVDTQCKQAEQLQDLGARRVLLKGGHLGGPTSTDILVGDGPAVCLTAERVVTTNDHGTGCTLSSAIAALRPQRPTWTAAVTDAKAYLTGALAAADRLDVGHGHGPVHHFWTLWPDRPPSS